VRPLTGAWLPVDRALGAAVCATLFALMVLTFADVAGRYLLNSPLPGTAELTELAMGIVIFGGLPLVTARRGQISVTLFDRYIPERALPLLDGAIAVFSTVVLGVFAWRIGAEAWYRGGFGDMTPYLHLPVAPFAWFMCAMAALSMVLAFIEALGHFGAARRKAERA
jgi:TRAP-type C4-dicarboxylate transport system permease small subunit